MSYKLAESVRIEDGKTFIIRERMQDITSDWDGDRAEDYEAESSKLAKIIYDKITDTDRWSTHHEIVFEIDGKYYKSHYSRGATEMQDERPYEYDGEWIEVTEVVPKEVTVIQYVKKEAL